MDRASGRDVCTCIRTYVAIERTGDLTAGKRTVIHERLGKVRSSVRGFIRDSFAAATSRCQPNSPAEEAGPGMPRARNSPEEIIFNGAQGRTGPLRAKRKTREGKQKEREREEKKEKASHEYD